MALSPSPWRTQLDQRLAGVGENVTLSRIVSASPVTCACRAFVRDYQPHELVGSVIQGDSHVIITGTELDAASWPGSTGPGDQMIPRKGDTIVIAGRTRTVQAAAPIYIAGVLARIDIQVRG